MCHAAVERGPPAAPSRMLRLQFILSNLGPGLNGNVEIKVARSFLHSCPCRIANMSSIEETNRDIRTGSAQMLECINNCHPTYTQLHAFFLFFNPSVWVCVCACAHVRVRFEICASPLCLSSKGFSPDNVMSGCVGSTNPSLDSNISSQSETPSSLCCVPSFHIQQH